MILDFIHFIYNTCVNIYNTTLSNLIEGIIINIVNVISIAIIVFNRVYYYIKYQFTRSVVKSQLLPPIQTVPITNVQNKQLTPYFGTIPTDISNLYALFLGPLDQQDRYLLHNTTTILDGYPMGYQITFKDGLVYYTSKFMGSVEYYIED